MDIQKAYMIGQENCNIKVGDKVRVLRKSESRENGWANTWVSSMDDCVGKEGEVVKMIANGIRIIFDGFYVGCFPWFVLKKIEDTEKNLYLEGHKKCSIKVGDVVYVARDWDKDSKGSNLSQGDAISKVFIRIKEKNDRWYKAFNNFSYPYFVLEKYEPKKGDLIVGKILGDNTWYIDIFDQKKEGIFRGKTYVFSQQILPFEQHKHLVGTGVDL